MCRHFKPVYQLSASRALVFRCFFANPLGYPDFLHAKGIRNHIGMITDTIDDGLCTELPEFITGKFPALIAARDIMTRGTVKESVVRTIFALLTHEIRKAAVTSVGKSRTGATKQTAYGRARFVRDSFHGNHPPNS